MIKNIPRKIWVYIAASVPRKKEANALALELERNGFKILSYWHQDEDDNNYHSGKKAIRDLYGIKECDLFVELVGDTLSRGGRHCELGIAIALNKKIILVGGIDDCIFTHLPWLSRIKTIEEFIKKIILETKNGNIQDL